ncbi:MAG: aminodeoxychorismate synthase component I [Chloroflexi bacterium]|nr:aminodeoxychorismate synthase component I [Chloroflexota bacterium]MCI0579383.1 aminodeoxychorismate synthase component I [Chloroflexota bacterium]MCI0643791.1 aminodeoxychorismate synthase component I [Chloroflexota bacterium]MCI0730021.1 aminodeoxychorismate synthase component I [Chloroflexota bacterium]
MNHVILQANQGQAWWRFSRPLEIITTHQLDEVRPRLSQIEAAVEGRGLYAAGFLNYEAAPAFDPALATHPPRSGLPLLWFGLYERPEPITLPAARPAYTLGAWQPSIERPAYEAAIARIRAHIAAGETYQVNYTFRLRAPFGGHSWGLFLDLVQAQQPAYAAYLETDTLAVCSASPELFFHLDGETVTTRPMKGTTGRGRTLAEDQKQAGWLCQSEKNRAENVMIVDMLRNDLGRIAAIGSVQVPRLFQVERYPTLWQMTSTVAARTAAPVAGILQALFPCASITGAPKVRTMQLIAALETTPRGLYTGCIGYLGPGRQAQFNVAIRTVVVDQASHQAEYGVGGGIVWDSVAGEEYRECLLKARILAERRPPFQLLESLRWTPGEGYFLLHEHLERLAESADYFGFPLEPAAAGQALAEAAVAFPRQPRKVRLLAAQDGRITIEHLPPGDQRPVRLALAAASVDSSNPFLYHKTTHRAVYDQARASRPGYDDVLLWNERGEITESTTANVVVYLDGEWLTPPVSCGLLPGTFRRHLLAQGAIREAIITREDLGRCQAIYLINSVRCWRPATL